MRFALLLLLAAIPAASQVAETLKAIDDVAWQLKFGEISTADKFTYTSQGMILYGYTFLPKNVDRTRPIPLIVFVHEGIHSNFMTEGRANCAALVRELLERGYGIVAPEYRGSTGYGQAYSDAIDYGGREVDDVLAARDWALAAYPFLDSKRVGIVGWSHGGFITLMNIFQHPEAYKCAYAGVPVSDLVARMGYKGDSYRSIYSKMLGKDAGENVKEYEKRSPYFYAASLKTPLLIHGNSNDEDVNVLEVKHLIAELKASDVKFESKIYDDAPGGHYFNRLDTRLARDSREEVYKFLDRYLKP